MLTTHNAMNVTKYAVWGILLRQRNENKGGAIDANNATHK